MTRPRASYDYADQAVSSPDGRRRLATSERGKVLRAFRDGRDVWSRRREGWAAKQVFIADDGAVAVLAADDRLTFRDAHGDVMGSVSVLERVKAIDASRLSLGTAGTSWDEFLAGSFLPFEGTSRFVLDGRGLPPLLFDPEDPTGAPEAPGDLRDAQRARASVVLAEALKHLLFAEPHHREPWRLAAVGWARVAGETGDTSSVQTLNALGELPLEIDGMTFMSILGERCPDDPIYIDRYALDPLRQAVSATLLRLGERPVTPQTMQLAVRRGVLKPDEWVAFDRPERWTERLDSIHIGAMPSHVVDQIGAPMHVHRRDEAVVWSYHHLAEGPTSTELTWGKLGVREIAHGALPPATPHGLVA